MPFAVLFEPQFKLMGADPSWHTLLPVSTILADRDAQLALLDTLRDEVGLDFLGNYAGLLGAFEIYNMPTRSEEAEPLYGFSLRGPEKIPSTPTKRDSLVFRRRPDFAQEHHILALRLYSGDYLIHDRLYQLKPNELQLGPITASEHFNRKAYALYDLDGNIIHSEDHTFMDMMTSRISLGGTTVNLEGDKISDQAKGIDQKVARQIKNVHVTSRADKSVLAFADIERARIHMREQKNYVKSIKKSDGNSAWFKDGTQESIESLIYLLKIINNPASRKIVIADPFFDSTAFEALMPRIALRNLPVTVLTSLTQRIDRNTHLPVDDWQILKTTAEGIKHAIHCTASICNAQGESEAEDRVFHDRYLMRYGDENDISIYMLSNSLNVRSRNFPFCIARLDGIAVSQVRLYLEEMLNQYSDVSCWWSNYER